MPPIGTEQPSIRTVQEQEVSGSGSERSQGTLGVIAALVARAARYGNALADG